MYDLIKLYIYHLYLNLEEQRKKEKEMREQKILEEKLEKQREKEQKEHQKKIEREEKGLYYLYKNDFSFSQWT